MIVEFFMIIGSWAIPMACVLYCCNLAKDRSL